MTKAFDKMKKSELQEAIAFLKLEDKVLEVAKDGEAPTNAEYVAVLDTFKAEQELANPEEAKSQAESVTTPDENVSVSVTPNSTPEEARDTYVADLNTMVPVIITDHDTSVTIDEDEENRTVAIRWGNPVIGMTTVNVGVHGRMQYVQKGAIIRLKSISIASHVKDANGKEVSNRNRKRFSVADTTGWTADEFASHATEQALKKI